VALAETRQPLGRFRCRTMLGGYTLLQKSPKQPRNAGIVARCLDSRPLGYVFFQGYGYVA
jgi:hypothetical protein